MRFFSFQLSPRWKFLTAILIITSIATFAFIRSEQIREQLEDVWAVNATKSAYLLDMRIAVKAAVKNLEALAGITAKSATGDDQKQLKDNLDRYLSLEANLAKQLNHSKLTSRNELALMHKLGVDRNAALPLVQQAGQMLAENKTADAVDLITKQLRTGPLNRWLAGLDEMINVENDANAQAGAIAGSQYEQLRTTVLLLCAILVVLGLLALWQTIKRNSAEMPKVPV